MIAVTATQAARSFANILDAVEHGETVVITRDGVPVEQARPGTPHISGPAQPEGLYYLPLAHLWPLAGRALAGFASDCHRTGC